ncbi:xanthine dehydrogenase family protein subunit M [Methylobacterium sp. 285MFTsu5.1]|uniref:FAD binding domain-containing protein n=1 Tax=Methylobacterium sp. 285MFTsu5.1 TaxID=1172187 RepID=UPI0003A25229|nr:xanthine dehydrogenase family protein subunit M [Methylobacterium sp. 285MFTsu5.1]
MQPFSYIEPRTRDEALDLAREYPGARFLAGGTTLIDLMKSGVMHPTVLIDVNRLPGMDAIQKTDGALHIGALARMSDVSGHPAVRAHAPGLSESLLFAASAQLRNMASIGGNLLQRTRCVYFRDRHFPCNKRDPGSGCGAMAGENRNLAVLGISEQCIANYPGDFAVMLVALDSAVHLHGPDGARSVAAADLHRLPGQTPEIETVIAADEIVTGVTVPISALSRQSHYLKVRDRSSYEYASVSVAAAVEFEVDGTIRKARLALGGLASKPWRFERATELLAGHRPDDASALARLADGALDGARPQSGNAYKIPQARAAIGRALQTLARRHAETRA